MVRVLTISDAHVHLHYSARRFRQLLVDDLRDKAAVSGLLVNPGSKAAQRGIREGDVISAINGRPTRCLSNGDSHALLRAAGDTLRLGLNQDTNGSPKRRSKEPLKREASSSSTQSTPSTPSATDAASSPTTPGPATAPGSDKSESTSSGTKVSVCGFWYSVSKTKPNGKHHKETDSVSKKEEETQKKDQNTFTPIIKASSSKARRLRKMKLKSAKREEQTTENENSQEIEADCSSAKDEQGNKTETMDIVVAMSEDDVRLVGGKVGDNETYYKESITDKNSSLPVVVDETETRLVKNKVKSKNKNGKIKGFSLSNIFSSSNSKNRSCEQHQPMEKIKVTSSNSKPNYRQSEELLTEGSSIEGLVNDSSSILISSKQKRDSLPTVLIKDGNLMNSSTIFTITEVETSFSNSTKLISKTTDKITSIQVCDEKESSTTNEISEDKTGESLLYRNTTNDDSLINQDNPNTTKAIEEEKSRPISIFVVPPDNVAEEVEALGINWESTSDIETKSQVSSSDDVHPETLIHLPSNDLQASTVVKDGRNGIIQTDEYELSVHDLNCPLIAPDEEATLRTFLETLNLTKPEEYDDTSSYGDSSSTSISEHSPIPTLPSDEIVVYRKVKSHSVAEPCYIPPILPLFLDVITEETSDPSDSERRNFTLKPWECSDIIRKNNEIDNIPNDWFGSDDEVDTNSEEGGIDTSWRNGKKLEDVDGVEVIYLSGNSEDEESVRKTYNENGNNTSNKPNLPELVIVQAIEREDVKSTVKLQPTFIRKDLPSADETKIKTHTLDDILSILDSTYEINKDLFTKSSLTESSGNVLELAENKNCSTYTNNRNNYLTKACNNVLSKNENIKSDNNAGSFSHLNDISLDKNNAIQCCLTNIEAYNNLPLAQESLVVVTPPSLSRRGSSSSATSQSTAKYNPGQSPTSSETEDKYDNESCKKNIVGQTTHNPRSLIALSTDIVTSLPHGEFFLQKLGFGSLEGIELTAKNISNGSFNSLTPSGISTRRSSSYELENIFSIQHNDNNHILTESSSLRPTLISTPPPSALKYLPPHDTSWVGVPTSTDPTLIVCLSPSQSRNGIVTSPKEATELLDLHKKFIERRGYHEMENKNQMNSPKSGKNHSPDFSSPDLIKLEHYEPKTAQVHTPELLIEAANLLVLQEYRKSRFKNIKQLSSVKKPELLSGDAIKDCALKKNGNLSGVTSPRPKIAGDSGEPDSNRSAGTSRLLALLQCSTAPHHSPNNTVSSEMDRADKSEVTLLGRTQNLSGSYLTEWLTMSENVLFSSESCSNTDLINHFQNVQNVVNAVPSSKIEKSKSEVVLGRRQFEADKYKISKKGDIAIIQTSEVSEKPPICGRKERPKSLPPTGVPALSPSGGELFREQMYHEYMNKVAERSERRQQKVIKISSLPISSKSDLEVDKTSQNTAATNKLESEFMVKARERMSKLGINLDEEKQQESSVVEEPLPKHLQEFIELTTATPQAETASNALGVWSPGTTPEPQRKEFNFSPETVKGESREDTEPVPPVWIPKSAQASPTSERKSFRPVNFESPKLSRKSFNQNSVEGTPKPPTDLPLSLDSPSHSSISSSSLQLSSTQTTTHTTTQQTSQEVSGRLVTSQSLPDTSLPRAQNPTITLLQKAREGQLPRGAQYLDEDQNNTHSTSSPPVRPNEILYSVRRGYESESEDKRPKKIELSPRKYDGIGPVTKEGIPIVLRSEVQDENQQKWYKRMYDSLHKAENDKEYVTVRYKTRRGRYPYTSAAGYMSEPEPLGGYDSDYTTAKYATLDRRRIRNKENDFTTSTMPRSKYNAVKHAVDVYKNQPGRIEDYEPGHSSIADKETKQWWDEVMDIFDGQFEQTQKSPSRTQVPVSSSTSKPFMTYALKESGYESDSTLVFKRRDETQQQLSPAEQKQAYKAIQKGGDVPLHGLRKPVPEKPKGPDESLLEYFPISPHLTRIRIHKTKQVIQPMNDVICYPITSIELDNPPPVFSSYKRTAKTSSALVPPVARPPSPPKRRSSHNSSTLRLYSKMSISPATRKTRFGRSSSSGVEVESNVQYLKDRISSKLGVSKESSLDKAKKNETITSSTTFGRDSRHILRTSSLSPSTIRTPSSLTKVSKKTSLERQSSSILRSRKDQLTPTRLAKSSELRAPGEVRKVLKQRDVKERSSSSKSLPPGTVVKSSTTLYSSSRASRKLKEDKQLKVTVAISAKGRELLRTSSISSSPAATKIPETAPSTITPTTTIFQPTTSSSLTVPKSTSSRPSSRSDSDRRPSSRSTSQDSPTDGCVKSPISKISTPPTMAMSQVSVRNLIKKQKNSDISPEVPKKKKEKNETLLVKPLSLTKTKKGIKENDLDLNGKKKTKKSKDANSSLISKKLSRKNGVKKNHEKGDHKKTVESCGIDNDMSKKEKDSLSLVPIRNESANQSIFIDSKDTSTKAFFQNLLLRKISSPTPSNVSSIQRTSSVLERAKQFHKSEGYSSLPYRSEPSLRLINIYLNNKKPVTESKFRSLDREVTSDRSSRSQSPLYSRSRRYKFLEKIDKFDKINNIWDKANGYFSPIDLRSKSPEIFNERSSSEPPRTSPVTNDIEYHEESFGNIENSHWDYNNMSPSHSRSPSCRRIRSAKTASKTIESIGGLKRKGIRAKSLSEADTKQSIQRFQTQSTSSLNLSHITDHSDYQAYVMELLHSTKKSERFKELHKFYTSLERMGELERTTSNTDLRPRKKGEEVIDYDRWKQLRTKERAEEELKNLYEKLKEDQKEKDLLFQPKDTKIFKWKGDRGLRSKEKSVEDLRQRFQRMAYEDSDLEVCKRRAIDATKDVYKPLWRGSSVVNLANTLTCRTRRDRSASEVDNRSSSFLRPMGSRVHHDIGSRLWSSLSMEQVNALKNQLSEIYTTVSELKRDRINKMLQGKMSIKDYEIVVPPKESEKIETSAPLHVRCNSLLTKEQLYSPLNRRKELQRKECKKSDSISSIPIWSGSRESGSASGESSHSHSPLQPMSEKEKKQLSLTLSQEVKKRVSKKSGEDRKKKRRISSSIVIPRETLGAVAAIKGSKKPQRMKSPSASDSSPRTCYSIEMSEEGSVCKQTSTSSSNKNKGDFLLVLTPKGNDDQEIKKVVDKWAENKYHSRPPDDERVVARLVQTTSNSETDSGSSEASTVIHLGSREEVQRKIGYLETEKKDIVKREFKGRVSQSAGDVRPFSEEIKLRAKSAPSALTGKSKTNLMTSQSFSDLKELFGEKRSSEYATSSLRKVVELKNTDLESGGNQESQQHGVDSGLQSSEESLLVRSRSISPDPMKYYRAYLNMVKAGDVRKLRDKFESMDDLHTIADEDILREPSPLPRRYQSDPDLTHELFERRGSDAIKTIIRGQEVGDVKWLKKRYENEPHRGRAKIRRIVSPIPLKSDNRFMPHINVISKLASLQQRRSLTAPARPDPCVFRRGEVDRLRQQFEAQEQDLSLLGQMFTSTPDIRELRDIAPYLECNWVAHQYPKPRSLSSPETQRSLTYSPKPRPASSSPTRRQTASILKPYQKKQRDIYTNQHYDPSIHRPLYRYQPPSPCVDTSYHYRPWTKDPNWWWKHMYPSTKPTVTFKEPSRGRVPVPHRVSYPPQRRPESPHRYLESEVTIHYRSPVRSEEKQAWSEDELRRRQAEAMRRIYQEERRRKYLQELQDMYSRRHTDNFTPSQKSPIPLNRYDDFVDDLSPGKPRDRTPEPKLVARALYNFIGQTSRELTFRRGDIIYVRRQIDKNWYEGEHNAMIGLFPLNYVEIIPYDGIRTLPKKPTEGQARAKFNFQAQTHLELPLVKGELVLLTRRVDNNWFEGRIGNRKGIFPVSYVEVLVEPGERAISPVRVTTPCKPVASPAAHSLHLGNDMSQHHYQPPRPLSYTSLTRQKTVELKQPPVNQTLHIDTQNEPVPYRVLYNYKPQNEDELELIEGEIVYVMEKCDDGWYVGSNQRTGCLGTFPGNYVQRQL